MMLSGADPHVLEVSLLLEAIRARYGYDFRGYAPASMRRRVETALARSGRRSLGELQHAVVHDPAAFERLFDDLTVRVSALFRDPSFLRVIRRWVLPALAGENELRIWHAGCADGEEVYTMAILCREAGLYDRAHLYATDVSPRAITAAKAGVYPIRHLAGLETRHRGSGGTGDVASHYTQAYDHVAMREGLRRQVVFFRHDLVADHPFERVHLLWCRNVLIYFGAELRRRVLAKLAASLLPGGFLCLGSSERLSPTDDPRFREYSRDERIYRFTP
jgi:chemotaxis protein methyltransferase CheR